MGLFNRKFAIINIDQNAVIKVHNKIEAEFYAKQFLKHCYESKDLVNNTKNPRVFFERYDYLINQTENLAELEVFLKFTGQKPSDKLVYLKQVREKETGTMIRRVWENLDTKLLKLKTTKGKENAINKIFKEFMLYSDKMTKSNIDLCNSYYKTFLSNI